MTATHTPLRRTRKTRTRPARRRALPHLGWGWVAITVVAIAIARTWPIWTALAVALTALTFVLRAIRPARLSRLWHLLDRIAERRRALPAPGRRTLDAFTRMRHDRFEHAIADLAREDKTRVAHAERVGGANDRGADVIVQLKDGRRVMIQCKRYNGHNVTSEDVQKTNGTYRDIHGCHHAVIVTTSGFTADAHRTNAMLHQPIRLIDGHALTDWANGAPAPW